MSNKIKVLHIITRLDKGGSAENTFLTLRGLNKDRYDITLLCGPVEDPAQDRTHQILESGIPCTLIPELVRNIDLKKDLIALLKIFRYLRKEKFDIIHTHTSKAGLLGRIAAILVRTPLIIHTPHGHIFSGYFGAAKTRFFIVLEKMASLGTDKLIALTDREKADTVAHKVAKKDKLTVIHSGIELDRFLPASAQANRDLKMKLGIPDNALLVGTVGRLVPIKGPDVFLKAAEIILQTRKNVFFLLAGDGYLREKLEKLTRDLEIEQNIRFLGWRDDGAEVISLFDVFVLSSLNEGMGRVLVEAMALEKPVVASDIGGIPDLIYQGENGILVPPKNAQELAHGIEILLEDGNKRKTMGQKGKKLAQNFSMEAMVKNIDDLYLQLLEEKSIKTSYHAK